MNSKFTWTVPTGILRRAAPVVAAGRRLGLRRLCVGAVSGVGPAPSRLLRNSNRSDMISFVVIILKTYAKVHIRLTIELCVA